MPVSNNDQAQNGGQGLGTTGGSLPGFGQRDLPPSEPLRRIFGPGVILAGAGIGAGEFVLWPYVTAKAGPAFLWLAAVGVLTQYYVVTEIVRYTLATGETAITGFCRMWRPLWIFFVLGAVLPNIFPAFATGASTLLTYALGGGNVTVITILGLAAIGISLTVSPVVYRFVERAQFLMVGLMLAFVALAALLVIDPGAWVDLAAAPARVGSPSMAIPADLSWVLLAAAVATAGSSGVGLLSQSNYVRDKGFGMGARMPRIVSPITGREEAGEQIGYLFPRNEENLRRWRRWWRVARWEQFLGFFVTSLVTIILFSLLAYSTVFGEDIGEDLEFIRAEGMVLADTVAPWFSVLFWLTGVVALFSTNLGTYDIVGRITADAIKVNLVPQSRFWTESKLYALTIATLIVSSILILAAGLDQPIYLLAINAILSGAVLFVFCGLLIGLNRRRMPSEIRIGTPRLLVLVWAVFFYGAFLILTVVDQVGLV